MFYCKAAGTFNVKVELLSFILLCKPFHDCSFCFLFSFIHLIEDYYYDICIVQNEKDKRSGKNNLLIEYIYNFIGLNSEIHNYQKCGIRNLKK